MKKLNWFLVFLILVLACNKKSEYDYPLIFTGAVNNITKDGADFNAKIVNLSKSDITTYGFVWDSTDTPKLESSEKYVIKEPPKAGVFSVSITSVLRTGLKYYVRAFISNGNYTTYGLPVSFISLGSKAPQILDFMPKSGDLGDTVRIVGHYFSNRISLNIVKFGVFQATVFKASPDTLMVTVPQNLNIPLTPISVSVLGNVSTSTDQFNLVPPVIIDYNPKVGSTGSQVTIDGKNFSSNIPSLGVWFDQYKAKIVSVQDNKIVATVPDFLDVRQCNVKVVMNNLSVVAASQFAIGPLTLTDFTPKIAKTGDTIVITGNNFSPLFTSKNKVTIGGFDAVVTRCSVNRLTVKIPSQQNQFFPSRNIIINVTALGQSKDFTTNFTINDQWFRLHDAPITKRDQMDGIPYEVFYNNGKAYIGLHLSGEFWEYTLSTDTWKRLADFPGTGRCHASGFILNNKLYFGIGYTAAGFLAPNSKDLSDWWEYDIALNKWTNKKDFAGGARSDALTYQYNNIAYVGAGGFGQNWRTLYKDFWQYNPGNDSWTKITDHPLFNEYNTGLGFTFRMIDNVCFGLKTTNVNGTYTDWVYKFDPTNNTWTRLPDYMYFSWISNYGFVLKDILYMYRTSSNYELLYWKDGNSTWKSAGFWSPGVYTGISFGANDKGYVGLGTNTNEMWEYDPSR